MSAMLMNQLVKRHAKLEKKLQKEDVSVLRSESQELRTALNALSTYAPISLKKAMEKRIAVLDKKMAGKSDIEEVKKEMGLIAALMEYGQGHPDYAPRQRKGGRPKGTGKGKGKKAAK